ncbi:MAG TPA: sulfotransferase domain-containing protein [Mycobacteriales bacterium]|nr:sulfotransferase domain-containing protein [Mycobacteriales bacterium]
MADNARWEGFAFRPDDVVISTPPKCGTTWMQTLCALLIFDTHELDQPMARLSPWLDMQLYPRDDVVALLDSQDHRRFIKTHTPLDGVPYDDRVLYVGVGRDPRDAAISSKNHMDNIDLGHFLALREAAVGLDDLADLMPDGPPPQPADDRERLQQWIEGEDPGAGMSLFGLVHHLDQFWRRRDEPGVALFHYQDMLRDLPGQMRRLRDALGLDLSDQRVEDLAVAATFQAMKNRAVQAAPNTDLDLWRSAENFFRFGSSGQWRERFDDDNLRRYDERVTELTAPDFRDWLHNGWLGGPALPDQRAEAGQPRERGSFGPVTPQ